MDLSIGHRIVAATNNQHKLSEIRLLIEPDFRILSLEDVGFTKDLEETQDTIAGNSLQKAAFIHNLLQLPSFADDTGLEVDALDGAPGVHSAHYAGEQRNSEDNINLLLKNMSGNPNREARFRTVITLVGLAGIQTFEGVVEGVLLSEKRGEEGFGYDPVFQPTGFAKSMAEMSAAEKNSISHRGIAVRKLVTFLKDHFLNRQA